MSVMVRQMNLGVKLKISLSLQLNQKMRRESTTRGQKEFGDYLIGKTIGQGTFGKVKSAIHKSTQQQVAIKILEKSKITEVADVERVSRQIHILKLIRHPHIVQLYEIIETPKQLFLVMQFMERGQLFDHIVKNKRIGEQEAAKMFHQLISGIEYIHKIGVVHRDLKPQNILLDSKQSLKIVDFGLSNTYKKGQLLKTPCGSPCYAAPEMIKGEKYDGLRVDIWSCGVILFAMLCGYLPFEDPDTPALYKKILSGSFTFHKALSDNAKDLISRILNGNQHERLSISEIRSHPWMSQSQPKHNASGIVIGFNKIPIDADILSQVRFLNFDPDYVSKCLEANRHNNATTAYYLSLKKYISEGGQASYDISSNKAIDKSMMDINPSTQIHKRKLTATKYMIDNYLTKSTETEVIARRKSKDKSRDKIEKQNRCLNVPQSVVTSINTEIKKGKVNKGKINESFNYGRTVNKSVEKGVKRQNHLENRISRKYKEKFNQSLVSRSRDKCSQRSRVNSSLNGVKKQLHQPPMLFEQNVITRPVKMKKYNGSIKCDTSKVIETTRMKPRRA